MAIPNPRNRIEDLKILRESVLSHASLEGLGHRGTWDFLDSLPDDRFASRVYLLPRTRPLVQPRGGFPTLTRQRELSLALAGAGADFIPLTIDSHTRQNDYDRAELLLAESEDRGRDMLNGYPLVTYGYEASRDLYADIGKPVSLRHGTPDARLLVENALATGITEIEGGALCYTLPYSHGFPLDRALLHWQYIDRLCAELSSEERPVQRESFGPLTATLTPPMMVAAIQIIELLLAAEQGVKAFSVSFGQTGNFEQDMALATVLRRKARDYLERFEFGSIEVRLVYHQWMGAFPNDRNLADHLIATSAFMARLAGVDKLVTKTRDEAFGIPSIDANTRAVRQVVYGLESMGVTGPPVGGAIEREVELISGEVDHLLSAIFDQPGDSFWHAVYRSVKSGIIDVPFSPHGSNANRLLALRDCHGAIRIQEPGRVPIRDGDLARERACLDGRDDNLSIVDRITGDIMVMTRDMPV